MNDYICKETVLNFIEHNDKVCHYADERYENVVYATTQAICKVVAEMPVANVQPMKCCKMIPFRPDCRGYTDIFICTSCNQNIHLGFIQKEYSGNYCLECGAEVKDGESTE